MKIRKQSILWGLFYLTSLVLVALAAAYVGRNFTGLGPTPTRSAFAGRLPGIPDSEHLYRFFYATNRVDGEETFDGRGNVRGEDILTGTYDVRISPYLPIAPFTWFDKESMEMVARQEMKPNDFWEKMRKAVESSPQKSVLVVVWGFRDWFTSAALKTAYTGYALDIDTPVLLFDWPGNQGEGHRGYAAARVVSEQSAPDLGKVLTTVLSETGAENVWVMGSSLGCQTICDALKWVAGQDDLLKDNQKLAHVVLSAPDVSAQAFDEKFADVIRKVAMHLTAYVTSNDRALLMSHWLSGERRLGRLNEILVPPEDRTGEYEFEEALELMDLQAKGSRNIFIVDATPINSLRNLHHFFTDSSVFFDELYQRLLQPDDIINRRLHSVRMRQGQSYWILWNE